MAGGRGAGPPPPRGDRLHEVRANRDLFADRPGQSLFNGGGLNEVVMFFSLPCQFLVHVQSSYYSTVLCILSGSSWFGGGSKSKSNSGKYVTYFQLRIGIL